MKMFVWNEGILEDCWAGILCILAHDLAEARRLAPSVLLREYNRNEVPFEEWVNGRHNIWPHYWAVDCAYVLRQAPNLILEEPGGVALPGGS